MNGKKVKAFKTRLNFYYHKEKRHFKPGERYLFQVKLKRPHGFHNPYSFDYQSWLLQNNYAATGYIRKIPKKALLASNPWLYPIAYLRNQLLQKSEKVLQGSPYLGIYQALVLGIKSRIDPAQNEIVKATATSHLLAISGLHVGIIAALFYLLGKWLWMQSSFLQKRFCKQHFALFPAFIMAFFYAMLAGFSLPTQRALLMLTVITMAQLLYRHVSNWNILAASLFVILLLQPLAPLNYGFWLSFYAVAIIFAVLDYGKSRKWTGWKLAIAIQFTISIAMIPIQLLFFHSASLSSFFANLFAVPVATFILIPGSFLLFFMLIFSTTLALSFAQIMAVVFAAYFWGLAIVQQIFNWQIHSDILLSVNLFMLLLLIFYVLTIRLMRPKKLLLLIALIMASLVLLHRYPKPALKVIVFDVGQGTSVFVKTANHGLLYDTGAAWTDKFTAVKSVILPYLQAKGLQQLDKLVLSHSDKDHIGDYRYLLQKLAINQIESGQADTFKEKVDSCQNINAWQWDNIHFEYLSAPIEDKKDNNFSCVLKITTGNKTVLLTGDIEQSQEQSLLKVYGKQLKSDVLLVPHHGSKSSSSRTFLQQVSAKIAISSNGYLNRFGHPDKLIVNRYQQLGIKLYRTDQDGAIKVVLNPQGFDVETAKFNYFNHWYTFF